SAASSNMPCPFPTEPPGAAHGASVGHRAQAVLRRRSSRDGCHLGASRHCTRQGAVVCTCGPARRAPRRAGEPSMKVTRTPAVIALRAGAAASALAAGVVDPRMTSSQPNELFPRDAQYNASLAVDPHPLGGASPLAVGGANDLRAQAACPIYKCRAATE